MKRGFFSVPGLFIFLVAAMIYFALMVAFSPIISNTLPMVDGFTQIVLMLILPAIPIGLLVGYYRSLVNTEGGYR